MSHGIRCWRKTQFVCEPNKCPKHVEHQHMKNFSNALTTRATFRWAVGAMRPLSPCVPRTIRHSATYDRDLHINQSKYMCLSAVDVPKDGKKQILLRPLPLQIERTRRPTRRDPNSQMLKLRSSSTEVVEHASSCVANSRKAEGKNKRQLAHVCRIRDEQAKPPALV